MLSNSFIKRRNKNNMGGEKVMRTRTKERFEKELKILTEKMVEGTEEWQEQVDWLTKKYKEKEISHEHKS